MEAQVQQLKGMAGVSPLRASKEVYVRDLHNRREVGALSRPWSPCGIEAARPRTPGHQSRGAAAVRGLLVELAWSWLKWQPDSA